MVEKTLLHTDVVVLGATVSAAGAVQILQKRGFCTVILERGQVCASEFADAMYTEGDTAAYVPETRTGAEFREELCQRDILNEQGICLPAVAPVISARLLACGTTLCAPACVTDITSLEVGYRMTFFSMGSTYVLTCSAILDTTASMESSVWLDLPRPAVHTFLGAGILGEMSGTVHGNRPEECFMTEPVPENDFDAARENLVRRAAEAGVKVIMTSMTAAVRPDMSCAVGRINGTFWYVPSTGYGTVTAAYDAGCKAGAAMMPEGKPVTNRATVTKRDGAYDVIVAGGGTAGAIAALTAAREGGRVLLLEDGVCLGGMGTAGGVLGYYFGVPGGIYEEVDALAAALQKEPGLVRFTNAGDLSKRMALGRLLREAGVEIRYRASAVDVIRMENRICGVLYREEEGIKEAHAAFVIDATADGVLLIPAGAQMMEGRTLDNSYQPFSNVFALYDENKKQAAYRYTDNGIVSPYDPCEMGEAILQSGCSAMHLWETYSGTIRYLGTAPRIGLREGKRIIGEETVWLEDILTGNITDSPVLWGYSNLDNHGKDNALEDNLCRRWNTVASMWGYNLYIPVPAGALIPRGMEGILAAGRCIAVDHTVASAVRMKYDMQKSGEAAAMLAMEAIRRSCQAREVPYVVLREKLLVSRCLTPETAPSVVYLNAERKAEIMSSGMLWREDPQWLKSVLESDRPGYGIWAASVHGDTLRPYLAVWIREGREPLCSHAALALGLAGCEGISCEEAIPHLLTMAADKSGRKPHSGRKYNYPYAISAAVLLELLEIKEAVDIVLPFVTDPSYAAEIPFEKEELTEDREDMIFQYTLQGILVLCGLGRKFPDQWARIADAIENRIYAPDFCLCVTGKGSSAVRLDYTEKIRRIWEKISAEHMIEF